jgi:hypothetical protein
MSADGSITIPAGPNLAKCKVQNAEGDGLVTREWQAALLTEVAQLVGRVIGFPWEIRM